MVEDAAMPDESLSSTQQPVSLSVTEQELDARYPNRPTNHSPTLPFHTLFTALFNPLRDRLKKPTGQQLARKHQGPRGPTQLTPHEARRAVIEQFISRWRTEVGNDIFPAFRLIIPEKDRERAMYGLKEKTIGKLLVQIMKIDKNSDDGFNLINWKLPGQTTATTMAGDFAGRCYEVLSKRPLRTKLGDLTVEEVNKRLDRLSLASKEEDQLPIMREFYQRMNPEEMMWLIRIILRQMKIGATERTILNIWHSDAETLFNVSSNLRRVCWELYDPDVRLVAEEAEISLMQCFQPQLAQFQISSFERIVAKMRPTENDPKFWIEEKLDGERMQLHMISDDTVPGGKKFSFWSRKAKDYTHLYGSNLQDNNSALTRHLKDAFHEGVRNIILDGEMITWNLKSDQIVGFGSLKTAALEQQRNPYADGQRPLLRVFDILYLNDTELTKYTLRDRRKALESAIRPVHRRFELHTYKEAQDVSEIEPELREVVAESSEGLVLKNPRSMYHLNDRNDDWIKVKPEYMTEFGEDLDCVVIGGYYGSGRRGGGLSSFLCGLRIDPSPQQIKDGVDERKCYSFFKVGGGFTAGDYSRIRHETEGKWHQWDFNNPPTHIIELAGGPKQLERPDVWIYPDESVVVSVKAASVHKTGQFSTGRTLRFPRFKRLRTDKDWKSTLSVQGFEDLSKSAQREKADKEFKLASDRRKRAKTTTKKELVVAGTDSSQMDSGKLFENEKSTGVFTGLTFMIMSESLKPEKKSKVEIEALVKHHGGKIVQSETAGGPEVICIAERDLVRVSALKKRKTHTIIRPSWILHCVHQAEVDILLDRIPLLIPYEPIHVYFARENDLHRLQLVDGAETEGLGIAADEYGDSFARDISNVAEMRELLDYMPSKSEESFDSKEFIHELHERGVSLHDSCGGMFQYCKVWFDDGHGLQEGASGSEDEVIESQKGNFDVRVAKNIISFGGGALARSFSDEDITHVIMTTDDKSRARSLRTALSHSRRRLPHVVSIGWVTECWLEDTLVNEERKVSLTT